MSAYDEAEAMAAHDAGATTQVEIEEGFAVVDPFTYRPGASLPNGATIIAFHQEGGDPQYYIVLAMWAQGIYDYEYVTWAADLKGECFWGHYHGENIGTAVADYLERASHD